MKIVAANSTGIDNQGNYIIHSPSRWSEGVKNRSRWFAYYPWELAYLSSLLKRETGHAVKFVDGCLERLNRSAYTRKIIAEKPDVLVMESATRMVDENLQLALEVKKTLGTKLIFAGQHASAFPGELQRQGMDHVCIGEYENTILELVSGKPPETIAGLYPNARRPLLDIDTLPWPEDTDVSRMAYGIPGEPSSEYAEIQMYASRGCPMSCNFCVARHVYYARPNWRGRSVKDVVREIGHLRGKYPRMQGVFFDEEVHNGNKEFIAELTRAITAAGLSDLRYEAMCDVRLLDADILRMMKKAGYYKIRIGIESASPTVLSGMDKFLEPELVRRRLKEAKEAGIKTYGTFTFGAWGASHSEDSKTVEMIKELAGRNLLDNLQVSICTPQPGTPFYEQVKNNGFLRRGPAFKSYDGGSEALVSYPGYPHRRIKAMKTRAVSTRDHFALRNKIKNRTVRQWAGDIRRRYGIAGMLFRAWQRLLGELRYCLKQ